LGAEVGAEPAQMSEGIRAASDALDRHPASGCHSKDTMNSGVETEGETVHSGAQVPVCRSGTLAIRSEVRASANAVENPADDRDDFPPQLYDSSASSIGPLSRPRRETEMCLPAA
jgi:hypothetical protein